MSLKWRKYKEVEPLPDIESFIESYSNLSNTICNIITGKSTTPKTLHYNFFKRLSHKVFKEKRILSPYSVTLLEQLIKNTPDLSEEDILQQIQMYLIQMYLFFKEKETSKKKGKFYIYDYCRILLVRYMADWTADIILVQSGDRYVYQESQTIEPVEPEIFLIKLDWALMKEKSNTFSFLKTRERYLLYLKYSKNLTHQEIADLTKRHLSLITKDFQLIKRKIGETNVNN